ncbi:hypothetical protein GGI35DRAFT_158646 [Trichoderma velutinum]
MQAAGERRVRIKQMNQWSKPADQPDETWRRSAQSVVSGLFPLLEGLIVMATWEAGAPLRWKRAYETSASPVRRRQKGTRSERRTKRRRTELQTAKKWAKKAGSKKRRSRSGRSRSKKQEARSDGGRSRDASGRGRLAQQAWKWSSWVSGTPQSQVRYPRLTPGTFFGAPQLAVGRWG